jgi:predicted flap endonuclease-1-like 5' DNA nuclease
MDGPVSDWARRLEREGPLPLLARARRDGGTSARPGRLGGGDDLQQITGVDARIEAALRRAGLTSWIRVAAASPVQIRAALASGGLGPVPGMEDWSVEAGHLASGDEAALAALRRSRSAAVGSA